MKPEEIARKYEKIHAGYKLIGYAEVGLPVTELNLEAYTIGYKKLSPIYEFSLKSIQTGLTEIEELSSFLGFNKKFVEGILSELIRSEDIALVGSVGNRRQTLQLTKRGIKTLEEAEQTEIKEQILPVNFDRILCKPIFLRYEHLYEPKELREYGWLEIPSIPVRPPELSDLKIEDVQSVMKQVGRFMGESRPTLLSIKNIVKRRNKFRYAVALRYRGEDNNERISFAIDGILNEIYEREFAHKDGLKKLNLDRFSSKDLSENEAEELQPLINQSISIKDLEKLKEEEAKAAIIVAETKEKLENTIDEIFRAEIEKELTAAEKQYTEKRKALDETGIHYLSVFDHPPLLEEALNHSSQRLMIISPWIRTKVVNQDFLKNIEILLKKGVKIYIGYGIGDGKVDPSPIRRLTQLATRYSNFVFKDFGNTHAKVLISDSKFVVVSSFNWLSFRGDPEATFRDEQGIKITKSIEIDKKFSEQITKFI